MHQRLSAALLTALALLTSIALTVSVKADSTDLLKQRFLAEAPNHWEKYRQWADRLHGSMLATAHYDGKLAENDRWSFKANQTCLLVSSQPVDGGGEQLWALNPFYVFQLVRNTGRTGWAISDMALRSDQAKSQYLARPVYRVSGLRHMLVRAHEADLVDLIRQPTFRLMNAESIQRDGVHLVNITFANEHPLDVNDSAYVPIQSGQVVLDPEHSWCIRSCDIKSKFSNCESTLHADMEMDRPVGLYPMPKRERTQEDQLRGHGKHLAVALVREFDLHEPASLPPDSEFTLSAYGLPEPMARSLVSRVPWFVWTAAAGMLCLIGSIVLARLQRRKTNMMPN